MIGSLCCTTEIEEALQINYNFLKKYYFRIFKKDSVQRKTDDIGSWDTSYRISVINQAGNKVVLNYSNDGEDDKKVKIKRRG